MIFSVMGVAELDHICYNRYILYGIKLWRQSGLGRALLQNKLCLYFHIGRKAGTFRDSIFS